MRNIFMGCGVLVFAGMLVIRATGDLPAATVTGSERAPVLVDFHRGFAEVAKKVKPALVYIRVEAKVETRGYGSNPHGGSAEDFLYRYFGFGPPRQRAPESYRQQGQGSGFLVSEDGYILTNHHVVDGADTIHVTLHDGREFDAELVGSDSATEVAVIKIDGKELPTARLGDSEALEVGEFVAALGNPFGLSESVSGGLVSAKGRDIGLTDEHDLYGRLVESGYENFIQTDAAINPGNSGGPLVNTRGEVVGVNTAIYSQSGGYMGIGFAIPIRMAQRIMDQLIETGEVQRGYIGIYIQDMTHDLARSFDLEEPRGILVAGVGEGSAGEAAGLEQGDILLKLDGEEISSVTTFRSKVALTMPGTVIKLDLLRDGKAMPLDVKIGSRGGTDRASAPGEKGAHVAETLGLSVEAITPEISATLGVEPGEGVVISSVERDSSAGRAGLAAGMVVKEVNREPVSSVKGFMEAVDAARKTVLLLVEDGQGTRFIALSLD
jgi:serine protease Do